MTTDHANQLDAGPFTPTHMLRYDLPTGGRVAALVQENNGDLYTKAEWDANVQPDWSVHCESGDPMYGGYFARDCFRRVSLQAIEDHDEKIVDALMRRAQAGRKETKP